MDHQEILRKLNTYANTVKAKYDCESIILFGSYAKGNQHRDSDLDVAVVLKDYDNRMDIQVDLMRLRRDIDSRIEPHPFRLNDFERSNPLVHEILEHGIEIHPEMTLGDLTVSA